MNGRTDDVAGPDRRASCLRHTKQLLRTSVSMIGYTLCNQFCRSLWIEQVLRDVPADVPLSDRALRQLGYSLTVIRGLVDLFDDEAMRLARLAAIRHLSERTQKDGDADFR